MNRIPLRTKLSPTHDVFGRVVSSGYYQDTLQEDLDRGVRGNRLPRVQMAFSNAALMLAEQETIKSGRTELRDLNSYQLSLAGQVNGFVASREALAGPLTYQQKRMHKERIIHFNHELRETVDHNQHLKPAEVAKFLTETRVILEQSEWPLKDRSWHIAETRQTMDDIIFGMWGEINGELIIGSAGYDINTDVSFENEIAGVDGWVEMRPDEYMPIDFKGNPEKALSTNLQSPGHNAIWTHLTRDEFGTAESFRIPQRIADRKAQAMADDLEALWNEYSSSRHVRSTQHSYSS